MAIIKVLTIVSFFSLHLIAGLRIDYPEVRQLRTAYKNLPEPVLRDIKEILFSFEQKKKLPAKYISKEEACRLNWKSKFCGVKKERCNLSQVARRKLIGGTKFINTINLPGGPYFIADVGRLKHNQCRGPYRIIYRADFKYIFFTADHYQNTVLIR